VVFAGAIAATPQMGAQGHADAQALTGALRPWSNGAAYLNFAESKVDAKAAYGELAWEQLKAIRSVADPDGVFVSNHVVPRFYEDGRPAV
jgi:hypothetical protein